MKGALTKQAAPNAKIGFSGRSSGLPLRQSAEKPIVQDWETVRHVHVNLADQRLKGLTKAANLCLAKARLPALLDHVEQPRQYLLSLVAFGR